MTKGRLVNTIYAACGKNLSRKACENVVDVVTSDVVRGLVRGDECGPRAVSALRSAAR